MHLSIEQLWARAVPALLTSWVVAVRRRQEVEKDSQGAVHRDQLWGGIDDQWKGCHFPELGTTKSVSAAEVTGNQGPLWNSQKTLKRCVTGRRSCRSAGHSPGWHPVLSEEQCTGVGCPLFKETSEARVAYCIQVWPGAVGQTKQATSSVDGKDGQKKDTSRPRVSVTQWPA